jgi:hypothetical protein
MAVDLATMSNWRSVPLYNPADLNTAVYAWETADRASQGLLLMHVPSQKTLWSTEWDRALRFSSATWTHDGSRVVLAALTSRTLGAYQHELIGIETNGASVQLSSLGASGASDYFMFNPIWSPNGRFVAFIFTPTLASDRGSVHVLDAATAQVTDYCTGEAQRYPGLFWSPDSSQLAFVRNDHEVVVLELAQALMQVVHSVPGIVPDIVGWTNWTPSGN